MRPLRKCSEASLGGRRRGWFVQITGEDFDTLLQSSNSLAVSVLCLPEIICALCRRRRERYLTSKQYATAKAALDADLADAAVIAMIDD